MNTREVEILVVGSGFGAAAPALRFAQAGRQVLMVEKGTAIVPGKDFRQTQDPKYLLNYIKSIRGDNLNLTYAEGLGGGSGFYESVSFRAPSKAFAQTDPGGHRLWPKGLTRAVMDPHYETAEREMSVAQIAPEDIPKSGLAFSLLMKRLGYSVERAPYAVRGCVGQSFCVAGCQRGSKVTLHDTYLDPARRAGAEIIADTEALCVVPLPVMNGQRNGNPGKRGDAPYRYDVICRNSRTGERFAIRARVLVLGGGTVGTARLLMASRRWLTRLSDQIGKNVAVNGTVKSLGLLPEDFPEGDMFVGRSHPGVISYHFLEERGITLSTAKPLPVDATSYANLVMDGDTRPHPWWGTPNVELMKQYRHRALVLYALGLTTPTAEIRLIGNGRAIPSFSLDDRFRSYYHATLELLHSIFNRNGGRVVHIRVIDGQGCEYPDLHITTAHMTGSARMADSPERGVVNASGEVFGYPGMHVSDGAAIPSSLAVNPYLTILANAERVARLLVRRYATGKVNLTFPVGIANKREVPVP